MLQASPARLLGCEGDGAGRGCVSTEKGVQVSEYVFSKYRQALAVGCALTCSVILLAPGLGQAAKVTGITYTVIGGSFISDSGLYARGPITGGTIGFASVDPGGFSVPVEHFDSDPGGNASHLFKLTRFTLTGPSGYVVFSGGDATYLNVGQTRYFYPGTGSFTGVFIRQDFDRGHQFLSASINGSQTFLFTDHGRVNIRYGENPATMRGHFFGVTETSTTTSYSSFVSHSITLGNEVVTFAPAEVPGPTTWLAVGLGATGLVAAGRARRNRL
jgi:hypothetical protein